MVEDKYQCCGCEACVQICPQHCITFEQDHEGFFYPKVDLESCIDCGLCEDTCPVINRNDVKIPLAAYAAKNKDIKDRLSSSSGGVFILLAQWIVKNGGLFVGLRKLIVDVLKGNAFAVPLLRDTANAVREHLQIRDGFLGGMGLPVALRLPDDGGNLLFLGTGQLTLCLCAFCFFL